MSVGEVEAVWQRIFHQAIQKADGLENRENSIQQNCSKRILSPIPLDEIQPPAKFHLESSSHSPASKEGENFISFQRELEKSILQGINSVFTSYQINQNHLIYDLKRCLSILQCEYFSLKGQSNLVVKEAKRKVIDELVKRRSFQMVDLKPVIEALVIVGKKIHFPCVDQVICNVQSKISNLDSKIATLFQIHFQCYSRKLNNSKLHLIGKVEKFTQKSEAFSLRILEKISSLCCLLKKPVEKKQVIACFSGFTKDSAPSKEELAAIIGRLGGKCALQGEFHEGITHVISPPSFPKTMRSLGASLLSKWVVSCEWLAACAKEGEWISEEAFAFKTPPNAFGNRKIHLSDEFFVENACYYAKEIFLTFFKRIVKAKLVDSLGEAEFVMVGESAANGDNLLSWSQFTEKIFPTNSHE